MQAAGSTIFALSSGQVPCAIAVIRISGPDARVALERLIGRVPAPRVATFARVRDPSDGAVIDEGLALWFPGPKSETGEDVAELQVHGGRAVVTAVLNALWKLEGFRHAEAGEFTRRAFDHGRLDLTAVEGLADLVAAETEAQRRQALRQMQGEFARQLECWRGLLIEARALLEAGIDFSDEDVPANLATQAVGLLRSVLEDIGRAQLGQGERLRDGLQVVIGGAPNVGKSTLLNRLARRDVAIVSPVPGTTRDVIEVHLDLGGYPVTLRDTAGIRATGDVVEREGVRRAEHWAAVSDLILWVADATTIEAEGIDAAVANLRDYQRAGWVVINKCDLVSSGEPRIIESRFTSLNLPCFTISAASGSGVDAVVEAVANFAGGMFRGESGLVTRQRHRQMLRAAAEALSEAMRLIADRGAEGREELIAEQARLATRALERLLGRVDVEDVLDVIFRDFCIGK